MATYDLQETYVTKNGSRETALQITGETHDTTAATITYGGVSNACYLELIERPSSADGYRPEIAGLSETTLQTPAADEFYVDFRTARIYFNSSQASTSTSVNYYGYGTVIRNEHINTLQTDLNKVQLRAMTALNGVHWALGDDGSGSIEYDTGSVSCSSGILYLPPAFDVLGTDRIYHADATTEPIADGSVLYCPIDATYITEPTSPDPRVALVVATYDDYCDLTDTNLLLAMRRGDYLYVINGIVIGNGEEWSPSTGSGSGGGTAGVYSTTTIADADTYSITHGLGNRYVTCQVYNSAHQQVSPDQITLTGTNTLTVTMTSFGDTTGYHIVVVG